MAEPALAPLWLLVGPEAGLKDAFIADIIEKAKRLGGDSPEIHRLYAGDSSVFDVLLLLQNSSLFPHGLSWNTAMLNSSPKRQKLRH